MNIIFRSLPTTEFLISQNAQGQLILTETESKNANNVPRKLSKDNVRIFGPKNYVIQNNVLKV